MRNNNTSPQPPVKTPKPKVKPVPKHPPLPVEDDPWSVPEPLVQPQPKGTVIFKIK